MVVRVRYVFGLARGHDGRDEIRLELPGGTTVFEAMQRLGVSALELHAAVNGESAPDGTVLRDGDEVTLIPAIQGGRGESPMRVATLAFAAALVAGAAADAAAQNRVIVPIFVPRPAAPASPGPSQITIQGPPQPAGASAGAPARGGASVPSCSQGRQDHLARRADDAGRRSRPCPRPAPVPWDGARSRAAAACRASRTSPR